MARYNTISSTSSVSGGSTIATPNSGLLTTLTGTGTVTVPNPVYYVGQSQTYYNSTGLPITLSTTSGNFVAPGFTSANTLSLPASSIITIVSDGTNYQVPAWLGGTISTPNLIATGGTIDNVVIGGTTNVSGKFSTLTATSTTTLAGMTATTGAFSGISTFTNSAAVTLGSTSTGALQVTAGGASIAGGLYVAGASQFGSSLTVSSGTAVTLGTSASGALQVTGGVGIGGGLYAAGASQFGSSLNVGGNLTVGQLSYTGTGFLTISSSVGSSFYQGTQVGAGYGYSTAGIFNAISQGPGSVNYSFMGWQGATPTNTSYIRADGSGYFANNVGISTTSPQGLLDLGNATGVKQLIYGGTGNNQYMTGFGTNLSGSSALSFFVGPGTASDDRFEWMKGSGTFPYGSYSALMYLTGSGNLTVSNALTSNYSWGQNRKSFNFGFSNSQIWFYIGYLPSSNAGTGDAMAVEITGIVSSINGKGRMKMAFGQRGGFWYSKSQEGGAPQVCCQVYQQADGSSRVWITNFSLSYPAAEVLYYTYGWGGVNGFNQAGGGCTIYDITANASQTTTPGGTLIFDSSNGSSYGVNEALYVGPLSKTSGSFRINHPLPALTDTHDLVHSFIEGPKADLIYRGTVVLINGTATVDIDTVSKMTTGTFEVLCRDVQCFVNNTTGWDPVKGLVTGNILTITCQNVNSTDTVSWMVVGERKDPHMYETHWTDDEGHVIVEPLKTSNISLPPEPYESPKI